MYNTIIPSLVGGIRYEIGGLLSQRNILLALRWATGSLYASAVQPRVAFESIIHIDTLRHQVMRALFTGKCQVVGSNFNM